MSPALLDRTSDGRALEGVDPRLLARRQEVTGQRRRRRRRWLGALLVVITAVALASWVARSPLLDVSEIRVTGADRTSTEAVSAAAGVVVGEALVGVDLDRIEADVESLPWIDEARARRDWSDGTITIEVTERTAVAALDAGVPGWLLVDAEGRVLGSVDEPPPELPVLTGVPAVEVGQRLDPVAGGGALRVAQLLGPGVRSRVVSIDAVDPDELEIRLAPAGVVLLGDGDQLDTKLESLRVVLSQVDLTDLATIDLRLPDTPVLTREPA